MLYPVAWHGGFYTGLFNSRITCTTHIKPGLSCATPPVYIFKMVLSLKLRRDWPFNYCVFVVSSLPP